jgi:hypothetical protein
VNSSIHSQNQKISSSRQCIHTKHVYSLIDTPKKEESYKKLSKHLEVCSICTEEFSKFQLKAMASQVHIPKAIMGRDLRESFEGEVHELFKVMNLNEQEQLKKRVAKTFRFADKMSVGFMANLVSRPMIKAYLLALFAFIFLKLFL